MEPDTRSMADKLCAQLQDLEAESGNWHATWQELSDFANPRAAGFTTWLSPGVKRRAHLYDSTAEDSAIRFAAGLHDALTSEGQPWFYLKPGDVSLSQDREVKRWLEEAARRMYAVFNSATSNFHPSQYEKYHGIGVWGTAVQFIGDKPGIGPFFQTQFLGHCYVDVNDIGKVDTVFRVKYWTARQCEQQFRNNTPAKISAYIGKRGSESKLFKILHACKPREGRDVRKSDNQNMRFGSWWVWVDEKQMISESGYKSFPYVVPRWTANPQEKYGRGPGHVALADAKLVNELEKMQLVGLQKLIDPPLLIASDGYMRTLDLRPAAQNRINPTYTKLSETVAPILTGARPEYGENKEAQKREAIKRAFFLDIFETPGPIASDGDVIRMSATEIQIRARDRLKVLGPIFSRLKVEDLGPMIERSLYVMHENGMLPPPPDALYEAGFDVEYVNPIAIAQGAGDVGSILQATDAMAPLAQFRPEVLDKWNVDGAAEVIMDRLRVPTKAQHSTETMEEIRAARAKAEQEARNAELNTMESDAMKNASQAQAALGGS